MFFNKRTFLKSGIYFLFENATECLILIKSHIRLHLNFLEKSVNLVLFEDPRLLFDQKLYKSKLVEGCDNDRETGRISVISFQLYQRIHKLEETKKNLSTSACWNFLMYLAVSVISSDADVYYFNYFHVLFKIMYKPVTHATISQKGEHHIQMAEVQC